MNPWTDLLFKFGLPTAAVGLILWKLVWPLLIKQIELAQNILTKQIEATEMQRKETQARMDRKDAIMEKQAEEFLAGIRENTEALKSQTKSFEQTFKALRIKGEK